MGRQRCSRTASADAGLDTQVGPPAAGMGAEAAAATRQRLGGLLQGCTRGAPFTLQRFAELLLAPSRQYSSFVKLVGAPHQGVRRRGHDSTTAFQLLPCSLLCCTHVRRVMHRLQAGVRAC